MLFNFISYNKKRILKEISLQRMKYSNNLFYNLKNEKYFEFNKLEKNIYNWWENNHYFEPKESIINQNNQSNTFVITMPPPNVTGKLHVGHALFVALQDTLIRFNRMNGKTTLWLPGTDHAGIATQLLVERNLLKQGINKNHIGRDKFIEHIWEWKNEHGKHITNQLRSLGASADWSKEKFTLDNDLCEAVTEAFIKLYEKGLIYKGSYMVNWSPSLQTALSDLEVEYFEEENLLYSFKYVLASNSNSIDISNNDNIYIPVSTTRPETILGDTAVCVHPDDLRYKHLIGQRVIVPFSNGRTIPGRYTIIIYFVILYYFYYSYC